MGNLRNDFITYIGASKNIPKEELEKLKQLKLPIYFYDDDEAASYYDETGGFHSAGMGWNPQGVYCGECSSGSCGGCYNEKLQLKHYIIKCNMCDTIRANNSPLYCDICGCPIAKIKLGDEWYDPDELEM